MSIVRTHVKNHGFSAENRQCCPQKLYAISVACPGRLPEVLCLETVSDTGDTGSGRLAIEYASRGCTSFQLHTLARLASKIFTLRQRSKFNRLPQRPTLDPVDGFVVRAFHVAPRLGTIVEGGVIRFPEMARREAGEVLPDESGTSMFKRRRSWARQRGLR